MTIVPLDEHGAAQARSSRRRSSAPAGSTRRPTRRSSPRRPEAGRRSGDTIRRLPCCCAENAPSRPFRAGAGAGSASFASSPSSAFWACCGSTAFAYGLVVAVGQQLSGLDPFKQAAKQQVDGYVYAADGHTILAVLRGSQSRVLVQSDQISPWIKQAIVATEDRRFFEHRGIDIRGMGRALWRTSENKSAVQGGSTITQQFVKNQLTGARAIDHAEAEGGDARVAARAELVEGRDPDRVPQHDLFRERRVRRSSARRARTSGTTRRS